MFNMRKENAGNRTPHLPGLRSNHKRTHEAKAETKSIQESNFYNLPSIQGSLPLLPRRWRLPGLHLILDENIIRPADLRIRHPLIIKDALLAADLIREGAIIRPMAASVFLASGARWAMAGALFKFVEVFAVLAGAEFRLANPFKQGLESWDAGGDDYDVGFDAAGWVFCG